MKKIFLEDENATRNFGAQLAPHLLEGWILTLVGGLGAGKTTLVQGIILGLGGNISEVTSPTFSLVHEYQTKKIGIIHCDFYRLESGNSLEDFGGAEFFFQPKLYLVEWFERLNIPEIIFKKQIVSLEIQSEKHGRLLLLPEIIGKYF